MEEDDDDDYDYYEYNLDPDFENYDDGPVEEELTREEALEKFFAMLANNPEGYDSPPDHAALSVWCSKRDYTTLTWHSCHYKIQDLIHAGFKTFVTYVNEKTPADTEYINDVLHPNGPWGAVLPSGSWARVTKGGWTGIEFFDSSVAEKYPGMFYNMLVALRQVNERNSTVQFYPQLKAVFGQDEALAAVHAFCITPQYVTFQWLSASHQSFNNRFSLKKFKAREYHQKTPASRHSMGWNCADGPEYMAVNKSNLTARAPHGQTLTMEQIIPPVKYGLSLYAGV